MKANYRIKIAINTRQSGYEENKQQIIVWLQDMIPVILKERKVATEKIFLHVTKQRVGFFLN